MANTFIHPLPTVDAHGTSSSLTRSTTGPESITTTTTTVPISSDRVSATTTTVSANQPIGVLGANLTSSPEDTGAITPKRTGRGEEPLQQSKLQQAQREYPSMQSREGGEIRIHEKPGLQTVEGVSHRTEEDDASLRQRKNQRKKKVLEEEEVTERVHEKEKFQVWSYPLRTLKFAERVVTHKSSIFNVLLISHLISAFFNPVGDCDETFNYWEPTHYLLYGFGFQTWEYSPVYALRSYFYVVFHVLIAKVFQMLMIESIFGKAALFYCVRATLGAMTALCETQFVRQVARVQKLGPTIASFLLCFLTFAPGMFHASTSYLPQTFAMNMLMLSFANWMSRDYEYATFFMGLSGLIGWPFCVLMGIPMGIDLVRRCGLIRFARWAVVSAAIALIPSIMVDINFYHRMVIAPLNIALYNSSSTAGSNLYGVEPWTFYIKNLLLNFNVVALLLGFSIGFATIMRFSNSIHNINQQRAQAIWQYCMGPMLIWLGLMMSMPHKEERFLYVIYPFVCLSTAYLCGEIYSILSRRMEEAPKPGSQTTHEQKRKFHSTIRRIWESGIVISFILFSLSRNYAMVHNYSAPLQVYGRLHELEHKESIFRWPQNKVLPPLSEILSNATTHHVCIGKEWYRFPSNFFFPAYTFPHSVSADGRALKYYRHPRLDLHFLKSDFSGLLPKPYSPYPDGTWQIPTNMNDMNREEPTRYSEISVCDYIIDLDLTQQHEPHYSRLPDWKVIYEVPYLDAAASPIWSRAFYIPGISSSMNRYGSYQLLKRSTSRLR